MYSPIRSLDLSRRAEIATSGRSSSSRWSWRRPVIISIVVRSSVSLSWRRAWLDAASGTRLFTLARARTAPDSDGETQL
jgi:hypothetical protein